MAKTIIEGGAIQGRLGRYFVYWDEGQCHLRILGSVDKEDVWTTFPCGERECLPLACLVVSAWENACDCQFQAIYEDREACWSIARAGEKERKRTYFYAEWFNQGLWHVASLHPRATA